MLRLKVRQGLVEHPLQQQAGFTATLLLSAWDMACSFVFGAPRQLF
jgi:hypothetical protein